MLSWITGSKLVDGVDVDATTFEPPETPAPVFAVRAFKHAIFGTPQPPPTIAPMRLTKKRKDGDKLDAITIPAAQTASDNEAGIFSPTKAGILLTPGTVRGKKKEVAWGAQVLDNESKKPSRSGIPNNCPGKFPSPWTPKTADFLDEKRPKTKLTEAFYEAKATEATPKPRAMRSQDDTDITIDIMEPRSESGRHWKEMYMSQQRKSEEQIGKLTAKYKLCKEHARRKDEEATELRRQVEHGSKKHRAREKELDRQIKELREQLRVQMKENAKTATEISLLRKQVSENPKHAGESPLESSTKKLKAQMAKYESPPKDSIWEDEAIRLDDSALPKKYLQSAVVQTHGEHARIHRADHHKRRLARKEGFITRQDSVVTPSGRVENDFNQELELSPTPKGGKDGSKALRRILADMSPNLRSSPPVPSFFSESDHERIVAKVTKASSDTDTKPEQKPRVRSSTHREAMAEAAASLSIKQDFNILDDLAPMSALTLQAEQPTTPVSMLRRPRSKGNDGTASSRSKDSTKRHKREEAVSGLSSTPVGMESQRAKAARQRLEARRAKRMTKLR